MLVDAPMKGLTYEERLSFSPGAHEASTPRASTHKPMVLFFMIFLFFFDTVAKVIKLRLRLCCHAKITIYVAVPL